MTFFSSLLPLLLLPATLALAAQAPLEEYRYRETTGTESSLSEWSLLHEGPDRVLVRSVDDDYTYENLCDTAGNTLRWSREGGGMRVEAIREGNEIHLRIQGKEGERREILSIDGAPWYQPLSYSLRRMVETGADSRTFWTIRPDNLEPVHLRAERDGQELLETRLGSVEAARFEVRLTGVLRFAWKALYWFGVEQPRFLRYEAVNGPPGTARTVIELVEKESS